MPVRNSSTAIALAIAVIVVLGTLTTVAVVSTGAAGGTNVLLPAGTVLHIPGNPLVLFHVPIGGGVLVGAAEVDHTSVLGLSAAPLGTFFSCPFIPAQPTYRGPSWSYTVDEFLPFGAYSWGAHCGGYGNVTITASMELLPE